MATTMSHPELSVPGDDMEVSSDVGRPTDEPFDIDIDFDDNPPAAGDEDSMMDDTTEQPADDLMRDGAANEIDYEDGIMLDGDVHVDEDIPDATVEVEEYHQDIELEGVHEATTEAIWDAQAAKNIPVSDPQVPLTTELNDWQPDAPTSGTAQLTSPALAEQPNDLIEQPAAAAPSVDGEAGDDQLEAEPSILLDHESEPTKSEQYSKDGTSAQDNEDAINQVDENDEEEADQLDTLSTQDHTETTDALSGSMHEGTKPEADAADQDASDEANTLQSFDNENNDNASKAAMPEASLERTNQQAAEDNNQEAQKADGNPSDEVTTKADENKAASGQDPLSAVDAPSGDKLYLAILSFEGTDVHLFPNEETAELQSSVLEDTALAYGPISDLLKTCRTYLAPDSSEQEYLIFDIPDLNLHISETSTEATHTSLQSILETHANLCLNDGNAEVPALRISTLLRSDCSSRLAELEAAVAEGKGYDYLFPAGDDPDGSEEQEASVVEQENREEDYDEEEAGEEEVEKADAEDGEEEVAELDDFDETNQSQHELQDESASRHNKNDNEPSETSASHNEEGQEDAINHESFEDPEAHFDENERELDFTAAEDFHNGADDFGRDDFAAFEEPAFDEQHFENNGDDLGEFGDFVDNVENELHTAAATNDENSNGVPDSTKTASRKRSWDDAHAASDEAHGSQEAKKSRPS